jgi:chromosome segregation ATPase
MILSASDWTSIIGLGVSLIAAAAAIVAAIKKTGATEARIQDRIDSFVDKGMIEQRLAECQQKTHAGSRTEIAELHEKINRISERLREKISRLAAEQAALQQGLARLVKDQSTTTDSLTDLSQYAYRIQVLEDQRVACDHVLNEFRERLSSLEAQ